LFQLRQRARLGRQIVGSPVYPTGNPIGRLEAAPPESPIADRTERDSRIADVFGSGWKWRRRSTAEPRPRKDSGVQ
jgi:hypothetical protein